jgi:hypothetical protein
MFPSTPIPKRATAHVNGRPDRHAPGRGVDPYARNARTHSDAQVAQITGSIREFGFTTPVLIAGETGSSPPIAVASGPVSCVTLSAATADATPGHGRVLAARKLGMIEVPSIKQLVVQPAFSAACCRR